MAASKDGADDELSESAESAPALPTPDEVERIPDPVVRTKVGYMVERFEMFRSPLLPPEVLARYGNVVPNLPEKFVQWTEDESVHRRTMEKAAFEEVRTIRSRAQASGVAIAALGLVVSGLVAVFGDSAGSSFVATVIAIVSVGGPFAARLLASKIGRGEGPNPEE
jgi:uncharacterized membrane protein